MCQVGKAGHPVAEVPLPLEAQEEFEIRISTRDGDRLEGYILHRRSGRRECVNAWEDVTDVLTRLLANAADQGPGAP